ncbi:hypothetical protein ACSSS7_002101 [Eimeria intestinalis]
MAAFRAGIRWADMSTESFSRTKTAPNSTANAALLLQAEQADQSYASGEAVILPEFENSQAGMNQYFLEAAALGGDEPIKAEPASSPDAHATAVASSSDKGSPGKASSGESDKPASKVPGFRGLLVGGSHAEAASAGGSAPEDLAARRRQRNAAASLSEAATLTPAKRNRRTSGAPQSGSAAAGLQAAEVSPSAQDGRESAAAPEGLSQRLQPHSKRRKSAHSRRSYEWQCTEQNNSISAAIISNGQQQGKRRSARGAGHRRSGGNRRASEGQTNPGLLLQMGGAPSFLQLPGLVSPMFMPVGLAPGAAAPLPGLLHPQVVQQQQARVNSSKEQQEQEDEEEWQRRESARLKDIAIGKATAGYRNFLKQVGTERRSDGDPMTPDAKLRCSKAQFQRAYQKWRKQLHQYDTVGEDLATEEALPLDALSTSSGVVTTADAAGESGDRGSAEQQDLEAILAFNKECELAGL